MNTQPECPICIEIIDFKKNCVTTECGHCFHTNCLMTSVAHNGFGCPYCRTAMAQEIKEEEEDNEEEDNEEEEEEANHTGQFRGSSLVQYCSLVNQPQGILCAHPGGIIRDSHWSCCGARSFRSRCRQVAAVFEHHIGIDGSEDEEAAALLKSSTSSGVMVNDKSDEQQELDYKKYYIPDPYEPFVGRTLLTSILVFISIPLIISILL